MNLRTLMSVATLFATIAAGRHTLTPDQQQTVSDWISKNPEFRQAVDEDCNCAKELKQVRSGAGVGDRPVPNYAPYQVVGDFNKDGIEDFAVVALRKTNTATGFAFLIFNGSADGGFSLAYERRGQNLRGQGLFYGAPEREEQLRVGPFYLPKIWFVPKGATYKVLVPSF